MNKDVNFIAIKTNIKRDFIQLYSEVLSTTARTVEKIEHSDVVVRDDGLKNPDDVLSDEQKAQIKEATKQELNELSKKISELSDKLFSSVENKEENEKKPDEVESEKIVVKAIPPSPFQQQIPFGY